MKVQLEKLNVFEKGVQVYRIVPQSEGTVDASERECPDELSETALELGRRLREQVLPDRLPELIAAHSSPRGTDRGTAPGTLREQCLVPLVIGIVGHRIYDPAAEPHLRAALKRIFTDLGDAHPETPLLLLSSLAQGADQLAV